MIPYADVLTLGRCGHAVTLEKGESLANAFLSFLGEEDLYYTND